MLYWNWAQNSSSCLFIPLASFFWRVPILNAPWDNYILGNQSALTCMQKHATHQAYVLCAWLWATVSIIHLLSLVRNIKASPAFVVSLRPTRAWDWLTSNFKRLKLKLWFYCHLPFRLYKPSCYKRSKITLVWKLPMNSSVCKLCYMSKYNLSKNAIEYPTSNESSAKSPTMNHAPVRGERVWVLGVFVFSASLG